MRSVRVLAEARQEVAEAVRFLLEEELEPSAARLLVSEYRAVINYARRFFSAGKPWPEHQASFEIRQFVFSRVPYTMIGASRNSELVVIAVAHQKREPGYWSERLDDI